MFHGPIASFTFNNRHRRSDFDLAIEEQLTILARYLSYTKGAPRLQGLSVTLLCSEPGFGPLIEPLLEKVAPNLQRLTIKNIRGLALQQLGDVARGWLGQARKVISLDTHACRPLYARMDGWRAGFGAQRSGT